MKGIQSVIILLCIGGILSEDTMFYMSIWAGNVYGRACLDTPAGGILCGWQIKFIFDPIVTSLDVYNGNIISSNTNNGIFVVRHKSYNKAIYTSQLCLSYTGSNSLITYPPNPNVTASFICACTANSDTRCDSYVDNTITTSTQPTTTTNVTSTTTAQSATTSGIPTTTSTAQPTSASNFMATAATQTTTASNVTISSTTQPTSVSNVTATSATQPIVVRNVTSTSATQQTVLNNVTTTAATQPTSVSNVTATAATQPTAVSNVTASTTPQPIDVHGGGLENTTITELVEFTNFTYIPSIPSPVPVTPDVRQTAYSLKVNHVSVNHHAKYHHVFDKIECALWCSQYIDCTGFTVYHSHCWTIFHEHLNTSFAFGWESWSLM